MKHLLLALLFLALPVRAAIFYDFRFDLQSKDFDEDSNKSGTEDFMRFHLERGRLDFQGKLNDDVAYRLRLRFNKPAAGAVDPATSEPTVNERDQLGTWVDHASVTQKIYEFGSLTLGKFASDIGGYEGAAAADRYVFSAAYGANAAAGLTSSEDFQFYTGVKVGVNAMDHDVAIHFANAEPTDHKVGGKFSQNKPSMGVVWKGNFLDGVFLPMYAYHEFPGAPGTATKGKLSFLSLGNRFQLDDLQLDLDILRNTYRDETPGARITNQAIAASVAYKLGSLTPKFQLDQTNIASLAATGGAEIKTKQTSTAVALEFVPDLKDRFRYHLAIASTTISVEGAPNIQKIAEFILGARLLGDFLKN